MNNEITQKNQMKTFIAMGWFIVIYFFAFSAYGFADNEDFIDNCLLTKLKAADESVTVAQIKTECERMKNQLPFPQKKIPNRIIEERKTAFNPYIITPHKMNYLLPVSITNKINKNAYSKFSDWSENLENLEAKFQLSIKVPLTTGGLLTQGDMLFFGFTLKSWWQLYSENISKPFRETNYQPEFFYVAPLPWHPLNGNTRLVIGAEHQSNGRSQLLSRSWNRVYLNFLYETDNFEFSFKPWIRLAEDEKENELSSDGDDNPDISDYMGHFELGLVYKKGDYEFSLLGRENFAEHHGGLELGFTFPLSGRLRGFAQFSTGYGESLIDYNHSQQRFGLGIALTNFL
jgi:phospholipase A1